MTKTITKLPTFGAHSFSFGVFWSEGVLYQRVRCDFSHSPHHSLSQNSERKKINGVGYGEGYNGAGIIFFFCALKKSGEWGEWGETLITHCQPSGYFPPTPIEGFWEWGESAPNSLPVKQIFSPTPIEVCFGVAKKIPPTPKWE